METARAASSQSAADSSQSPPKLALFGGPKTIEHSFPVHQSIGVEEKQAVQQVLDCGVLSQFIGGWCEDFYGGKKVKEFERAWEKYFSVQHAISVNSCTSGLMCAMGAIGLEPGDEVIVSPWTMSADAAAILLWNAIPVFADIEPMTFNLNPDEIEKKISSRTRAILVSDIFGHAAKLDEILKIARKHKLKVIEDAAQAPGAKYRNQYVGTIGDIGVYSMNYHKHIHTGEGGVCVTNDPKLAERMQLIRNHAESVVGRKGETDLANMIGFNFRMGEMEAAIGIEQLKKLEKIVRSKTEAGEQLTRGLRGLKGLRVPEISSDCSHVFYVYPLVIDPQVLHVSRERIIEALCAEGVPGVDGAYVNLHTLPLFQRRIAYGESGFPWMMNGQKSTVQYGKGICPVAEELHEKTFLKIKICSYRFNREETASVVEAFKKVWNQLEQL